MKRTLLFLGFCMILCGALVPNIRVSAQELEEYTGHITDPEFAGIVEEMVGNLYETMSTMYSINWTIPKNKRYTTGYFKKEAGTYVNIGIHLSSYSWAGIIDMDGYARYVAGTDLAHSFKITKLQYYSFFVKNQSTGTITAKGYYVR